MREPCPLPLVALAAHETCPRCGRPAREHRGHPAYEETTMTETTEPTREQIEDRLALLEGLSKGREPTVGWETDLAVYRMALDAEHAKWSAKYWRKLRQVAKKQLAAMTERAEKAERECAEAWDVQRMAVARAEKAEAQLESSRQVEACSKAFHDLAIKERDFERARADRLEEERDTARAQLAEMTERAEKAERDVAEYSRAIGEIEAVVGICGTVPLLGTVNAVRVLRAKLVDAERRIAEVERELNDAHAAGSGKGGS